MKRIIFAVATIAVLLTSCENSSKEFPEYIYQTISFANPSPIRTLIMGDDGDYSTEIDNRHAFEIYAVLGGVNVNRSDRWVEFVIDDSMVDGLTFTDSDRPVKALPSGYYTLSDSKRINIKKGNVMGSVEVQLTDAFFNDPETNKVTYVLPVRLVNCSDSILQGKAKANVVNPDRLNSDDWEIQPKDFTLYAVTYVNKYHGVWLSTGTDQVTVNGQTSTVQRNPEFLEKADLRYIYTKNLSVATRTFSHNVSITDAEGKASDKNISITVEMAFDENDRFTVTSVTEGCKASGSGTWTHKGAPKAWGNTDRDLITAEYEYEIPYVVNEMTGATDVYKVKSTERLVMRDRNHNQSNFSYKRN